MGELKLFTENWIKLHLTPLSADSDCSVETWLTKTKYTVSRKEELYQTYMDTYGRVDGEPKYFVCKSFIKDENYPTYKYPRAINSRTDAFKVRVGPIFKLIEEQLFKLPYFVKYVPTDKRPSFIKEKLHQEGATIFGSDFTSWEALCVKALMDCCEMPLYSYMSQNLPDRGWYVLVYRVLTGTNVCHFKWVTVRVKSKRMSGEMSTSLGNGFTNLMTVGYTLNKKQCLSIRSLVEGDDGAFSFYGPLPTEKDFERIGMLIKITQYDTVVSGSFCGVLADFDELITIRDPIEAILSFGWTTRQYAFARETKLKQLLVAKALSMAFQYPGCPILSNLARLVLKLLPNTKFRLSNSMSIYEKEKFLYMYEIYKNNGYQIPYVVPGPKTRLLMEKTFKVTVHDQVELENYFDSITSLGTYTHPLIIKYASSEQIDNYTRFVFMLSSETGDPSYLDNYRRAKYRGFNDVYD